MNATPARQADPLPAPGCGRFSRHLAGQRRRLRRLLPRRLLDAESPRRRDVRRDGPPRAGRRAALLLARRRGQRRRQRRGAQAGRHPGHRRRRRRPLRPRTAPAASRPRRRHGRHGRPARRGSTPSRTASATVDDREEPRIDFGFFNQRSDDTDAAVCSHLRRALEQCDAVIFNQQVPGGLSDDVHRRSQRAVRRVPATGSCCATRGTTAPRFSARLPQDQRRRGRRLNGVALEPASTPALPDLEAFAAASSPNRASPCSSHAAHAAS